MNNPIFNLFKYTWKYSYGQRWKVAVFMGLSIIANVIQLANPYVVSRIFNTVQFSADDPALLRFVVMNIIFLVVIEFGFWLFHGTSRILERQHHYEIRKNYKEDMIRKVLDLPASWHRDHHSGDTIDKINTAGQSLYMFSGRIFFIIQTTVALLGTMIVLAFFDWRASVIAASTALVAIGGMLVVDRILQKRYRKLFKFENFFATAVHDYVSNIMTIITLKLKDRVMGEIDRRGLAGYPTHKKNELIDESKWFVVSMLISIMTVTSLALYAIRSFNTNGVILIGTLFALYGYLQSVGRSFFTFAFRYGEIVRENAAVEAAEVLVEAYDKIERHDDARLPEDWQMLDIKKLTFSYALPEDSDMLHLDGVDLNFTRGERVAFVGESGSGKSTTLAVLRGLYEATEVTVSTDGIVLPHGLRHLYQQITLVPQDPEIFNSTVEDNITMEVSVEEQELHSAIDQAQFASVISRLPQGLATNVMEKGVSLSGGEKQRLALARGLLAARDSAFLFLDEPTSSVDAINEAQIYDNIFARYPEKTIVSTIHRLHLLNKFDRIYHFDNGKIIASGTLNEIQKTPKFKELWDKYHKQEKGV